MDNIVKHYSSDAKARPLPLVFDSPHSGVRYPDNFGYACSFADLEYCEDKFVDELFDFTPSYGADFLCAEIPRSYIDLNRRIDDIDPDLFSGVWPAGFTPPHIAPSSRSDAGIGLVRRLVKPGLPVYDRMLTTEEIHDRITQYYVPYHNKLAELINAAHYKFGQVWHINCHSMPHFSAFPKQIQASSLSNGSAQASDFVIGNRDGTTCSSDFVHMLRDQITSLGYRVSINDPFKGVELIDKYSNPLRGYHSVQIEINKSLYMNEETHLKNQNYGALKSDLEILVKSIAAYAAEQLKQPLAAD